MDKGCLIDGRTLIPGDMVFHIEFGNVYISRNLYAEGEKGEYLIRYVKPDDFIRQKEQGISYGRMEYHDSVTLDGKRVVDSKYPTIYAGDPFEYAFELVEKYKLEAIRNSLIQHKDE